MSRPAALALLVVLAACAGPPEPVVAPEEPVPPAQATPPPAGPPTTEPAPAAVPEQLDFSLPALGGGQVEGAALAGRALALWFWTPW